MVIIGHTAFLHCKNVCQSYLNKQNKLRAYSYYWHTAYSAGKFNKAIDIAITHY